MNKLFIFDLDGVLVDSREIHLNALNLALSEIDRKYVISRDEQARVFEGLTTRSKLEILTRIRGLDRDSHDVIWQRKQGYTSLMFASVSADEGLSALLNFIKINGISVGVASNSIRSTLDGCLKALGIEKHVDYSLSNEDVTSPKPSPEIYLKCMSYFDAEPKDTVIFEDSPIGRAAATASGARLIKIENRTDLTFEKVLKAINGE